MVLIGKALIHIHFVSFLGRKSVLLTSVSNIRSPMIMMLNYGCGGYRLQTQLHIFRPFQQFIPQVNCKNFLKSAVLYEAHTHQLISDKICSSPVVHSVVLLDIFIFRDIGFAPLSSKRDKSRLTTTNNQ